jgi:hypothetical protein
MRPLPSCASPLRWGVAVVASVAPIKVGATLRYKLQPSTRVAVATNCYATLQLLQAATETDRPHGLRSIKCTTHLVIPPLKALFKNTISLASTPPRWRFAAHTLARSAAGLTCAFWRAVWTKTEGRARTHQRPRQGFRQRIVPTQCPHGWPACRVMPANAVFLPIRPMTDDHGKVLPAEQLVLSRARKSLGEMLSAANRQPRFIKDGPDHLSESRWVGGNLAQAGYSTSSPAFAVLLRKSLVLAWKSWPERLAKTLRRLRSAFCVMSAVWWPRARGLTSGLLAGFHD